ncbi:MAG: hypothetical protein M3O50_19215 [Myxococcota bacterium]|nr:hypothetical protein [Myxococcota bacterium]
MPPSPPPSTAPELPLVEAPLEPLPEAVPLAPEPLLALEPLVEAVPLAPEPLFAPVTPLPAPEPLPLALPLLELDPELAASMPLPPVGAGGLLEHAMPSAAGSQRAHVVQLP